MGNTRDFQQETLHDELTITGLFIFIMALCCYIIVDLHKTNNTKTELEASKLAIQEQKAVIKEYLELAEAQSDVINTLNKELKEYSDLRKIKKDIARAWDR